VILCPRRDNKFDGMRVVRRSTRHVEADL